MKNLPYALASIVLALASIPASAVQQPSLIVPCGDTGEYPFNGQITIVVPTGGDAVAAASAIIANEIADDWACGICIGTPPYSCQKGGTGPADPSDFTPTSETYDPGTNTWTFVGIYDGGIDVSCRKCL